MVACISLGRCQMLQPESPAVCQRQSVSTLQRCRDFRRRSQDDHETRSQVPHGQELEPYRYEPAHSRVFESAWLPDGQLEGAGCREPVKIDCVAPICGKAKGLLPAGAKDSTEENVIQLDRCRELEMAAWIPGIRADQIRAEIDSQQIQSSSESGCAAAVHSQDDHAIPRHGTGDLASGEHNEVVTIL